MNNKILCHNRRNMYRMTDTEENISEPPSTNSSSYIGEDSHTQQQNTRTNGSNGHNTIIGLVSRVFKRKSESLREAIEEYIEETEDEEIIDETATHERELISNILKLRDLDVRDIMVPRADIISIDIETSQKDLLSLLSEKQFSRLPVFRESLDDIVGTIHIKDILSCLAVGKRVEIEDLIREVPIVSPAMSMLDLILMMQQKKRHMALVVDEFGGIDGLVTIGDVIEAIVGEIEDEYDHDSQPEITKESNGSYLADARLDIEDFEKEFGEMLTEEEREDVDTLGGLVNSMAGRVPTRGEVLSHPSGITFEILEADPRRVSRMRIKDIPI
jgi:CBS domain containing-hemolysin-like protein